MSKKITVCLNGEEVKTKPGVSVHKLLELNPHLAKPRELGAIVNNRLMGLYYPPRSDCTIDTINYSSKEGASIYRRTISLILLEAFSQLFPEMRLEIGQSFSRGYYYHVYTDKEPVNEEILAQMDTRMREIVASNRPIRPTLVASEEAEDYFKEKGYPEKVMLLRQRQIAEAPWVVMGEFRDLSYGPVAPNTGLCDKFMLFLKSPGLVLSFPDKDGRLRKRLPDQEKLFATYRETRSWNEMHGVWNIAQLNQACIDGSISDVIKVSEGLQEKKLARLADRICGDRDIRLILIAGPSSSGKTTMTKRLAIQLRVNGVKPVMLSMDNYYVNRELTPRDTDGAYNFECLEALDVALFNEHLAALLDGGLVDSPVFNFQTGKRRKDKSIPLKLQDDQILIVEGIHGLNPKLSASVSANNKFRLYVSALTQLCIDEHNRIFTSDIRLMRRIVRDRLYRAYSAQETINQWPSVREGENRYIFPFQEEADMMYDTSLVYEPAVLRPFLQRFLMEVDQENPAYIEAYRLFRFIWLFIPIFQREIPPTSIMREFIGGSTFDY